VVVDGAADVSVDMRFPLPGMAVVRCIEGAERVSIDAYDKARCNVVGIWPVLSTTSLENRFKRAFRRRRFD